MSEGNTILCRCPGTSAWLSTGSSVNTGTSVNAAIVSKLNAFDLCNTTRETKVQVDLPPELTGLNTSY